MTGSSQGSLIIAVTADDDRYAATRREAMRFAKEGGRRLVLYDWDAATVLGDPLPSDWSAEGTRDALPPELDVAALEAAGRDKIARQVAEARAEGLDARAWLPSKTGAEALMAFATERGAHAVFVAADLKPTGLLEQATGGASAHDIADRASSATQVVIVGEDTAG
ncbi:MAG TPA: hypothetical protein VGO15_07850 [Candidatus Limnocylindrales bacterium]|nr:hypothetical protein [Candidatus Limnocylindrales bacterium]